MNDFDTRRTAAAELSEMRLCRRWWFFSFHYTFCVRCCCWWFLLYLLGIFLFHFLCVSHLLGIVVHEWMTFVRSASMDNASRSQIVDDLRDSCHLESCQASAMHLCMCKMCNRDASTKSEENSTTLSALANMCRVGEHTNCEISKNCEKLQWVEFPSHPTHKLTGTDRQTTHHLIS